MTLTVLERFLKYVSVYTTSDETSSTNPSAERELDLALVLVEELKAIGISDVSLEQGYVYAYIPASEGMEEKKAAAFISHMDTAPDFNGKNVHPQILRNYNGKDVVLAGTGDVLSVSDFPDLAALKGRTLITTDGTSLLGSDDKAGIAEILCAAEEVLQSGSPHGEITIVFTPDEEIGRGTDHFSFERCRAAYGFTVDGGYEGEVACENFNAASAKVTFTGKNVHPGSAKDIMVNAALAACEFQRLLPEAETPEHTENREGFYHLTGMRGNCEKAELSYIIRDHSGEQFEKRKAFMADAVTFLNAKYGRPVAALAITDQYRNMAEVMEKHPDVIAIAKEAIRSAGLTPVSTPIRGGTDGAMLSFKGLPCPNLGTGGYAYHGPYEHCTVEGMQTMVRILTYLMTHPLD